MTPRRAAAPDPYADILTRTDAHRARHGCWAYPFRDGPALGVLAAATGAGRVLELGTALGYTACWLAHGATGARVDTVERDPAHVTLARENLGAAGLAERVQVIAGDFDDVLPTLEPGYDLVFVDGHAPSLGQLGWVRRLLRPRGVLVTANLDLEGGDAVRAALARTDEWMTAPLLEGGRTTVSIAL